MSKRRNSTEELWKYLIFLRFPDPWNYIMLHSHWHKYMYRENTYKIYLKGAKQGEQMYYT